MADNLDSNSSLLPPDFFAKGVTLADWRQQTCGNCEYYHEIRREDILRMSGGDINAPRMGDCFEGPPTPMILGVRNGAPAVSAMYPRMPINFPACRRFATRVPK